uniref:Uncharacterized protein n=1 Tax=Globodera rostochiensis TaxID=31243 RepID=A0A914HPC8_GLORO
MPTHFGQLLSGSRRKLFADLYSAQREELIVFWWFRILAVSGSHSVIENPCPPLSSLDDDLTVNIGDRQVTVSALRLMSVSPMQRTINLDWLGINMEQFMEFLEAVSICATPSDLSTILVN